MSTVQIPLWGSPEKNRNYVVVGYTLIDSEDYEVVNQFRWHTMPNGYVAAYVPEKWRGKYPTRNIYLHRLILGFPEGKDCDHINHVKTDNRRSNLRTATRSQNIRHNGKKTPMKYRGIQKTRRGYVARLTHGGVKFYLGTFRLAARAARAYDKAVWCLKPEDRRFAVLNFASERHLVDLTLRRRFYPQESAGQTSQSLYKAA